jgi:anti-sigma-K factor RskA
MNCDQVRDLAAAYVLGALERGEEQAVREHLEMCVELHEEFAELGGVVPHLAEDVDIVEPPAALKARILEAAAREPRPAPTVVFPSAEEREARARARTSRTSWILRIAAVLVIGALGAWNVLLQQRYDEANEFRQAVTAVLETARQPGSMAAILQPPEGTGPSGLAAVAPDGTVTLALQGLAPTTGSEVYTAWMIAGDAAPVPVGGFTVGPDGIAQFRTQPGPVQPGVVLAVSREPGPGSTTPAGPIVAVGAAGAPTS